MASNPSALRTSANANHAHAVGETCPYCEQPIPNDRAEEIRARYELKQRQEEAALKARVEKQVGDLRLEIEAAKKTEIDKIKQEGAAALEKVQTAAITAQQAAREAGKHEALAEAQEEIEALTEAQEADQLKLQEAEQQKTAALAEIKTLKANQEAAIATRTAEVRSAIEQSKNDEINTLKAQHATATQELADQLKVAQKRLVDVEGEGANINLLDALKEKFPKDEFVSVRKTSGADIIQTVKHNKKECGKIVYDSRNRNIFHTNFATNLRADMGTANAQHGILTTSKFPAGIRHVHYCEGVVVMNPVSVLVIAEILREEVIRAFGKHISDQDREKKTEKLYKYISSDGFGNLLDSLSGNDEKLLQLDEDEQKAHRSVWEKRRKLATTSQRLHGNLRHEIDRIIGTAETE